MVLQKFVDNVCIVQWRQLEDMRTLCKNVEVVNSWNGDTLVFVVIAIGGWKWGWNVHGVCGSN